MGESQKDEIAKVRIRARGRQIAALLSVTRNDTPSSFLPLEGEKKSGGDGANNQKLGDGA
jgi:hypothetical protein